MKNIFCSGALDSHEEHFDGQIDNSWKKHFEYS